MPYSSNNELPVSVKSTLPAPAQSLFRSVVNSRLKAGQSEERAFRQAWATVSRSYRKPDNGGKWIQKAEKQTLFARRRVLNGEALRQWALFQGFKTTLDPDDFHVTIAYSKKPVEWPETHDDDFTTDEDPTRTVERLGPEAVVLRFHSTKLHERWRELCEVYGCSWDFPEYKAHITISWKVPEDFDLSKIEPFDGQLMLGPEEFSALDENWSDSVVEKRDVQVVINPGWYTAEQVQELVKRVSYGNGGAGGTTSAPLVKTDEDEPPVSFIKVDDELGLAFGWAIVCKEGGKEYFDVQGDCVAEEAMLKASSEFMETKRSLKIMHAGAEVGKVVFAWPVTEEISKAMGITCKRTGLMIAVKPADKTVLAKFKSGEWAGFSIGGIYGDVEEVV